MKKCIIVIGHYGSGKTEFAINYALNTKVDTLVDLDIVNPYFRSSDAKKTLNQAGIKVISPNYANTNIDVPSVSSEVFAAFQGEGVTVFDVGGDDDGAIALGRFNQHFKRNEYQMLMVINTKRPMTECEADIINHMRLIEQVSRLNVTGLVNNTNVMDYTTIETVMQGQRIIENVSKEISVPITHISGMNKVLEQLPNELKSLAFPLNKYLIKPWEV